jgi:energy-coupling factor transporter ATP-binding protein EcfA2
MAQAIAEIKISATLSQAFRVGTARAMRECSRMRLLSLQIHGFRRFGEITTLRVRGRTMAVLGHNESGKTSLLQALRHLGREGFAAATEFTDRQPRPADSTVLSARFEIEERDVAAVMTALEGRSFKGTVTQGAHWELYKKASGKLLLMFIESIKRDRGPRATLAETLHQLLDLDSLTSVYGFSDGEQETTVRAAMAAVRAGLIDEDSEDLKVETLDALSSLLAILDELAGTLPEPSKALDDLREEIRARESDERADRPSLVATRTLSAQRPEFIELDANARSLPTYTSFSDEPSRGLVNLLGVAGADFASLASLAGNEDGREALVEEERQINLRIEQLFGEWSQRKVSPAIKVSASGIEVVGRDRVAPILDPPLSQRGEGMRMFAALVAFLHAKNLTSQSPPVLLVDEAEMHLHYDGQADLVRLFDKQDLAQCVIYTTHSIGCLPEDLGLGLVVVEEIGDERSRISQSFWTGGPGLTPVMIALGATVHSFTPARRVMIGEGAHEAILLPTLLRQAHAIDSLGFQVVGGLAEISESGAARLDEDAGTVVYLVDNDEAGRAIAALLPQHARAAGRVFTLGDGSDATCIEDFVASTVLAQAIDDVLEADGRPGVKLDPDSFPPAQRAEWIDQRLEDGGSPEARTRVAQTAVLTAWDGGLVEPARLDLLRELLVGVRAKFPPEA